LNLKTGSDSISAPKISLAPFLTACPGVIPLGVRPCLDDYSEEEKALMRRARWIFFPTVKYVEIFRACQIPTFPCATTYRYQRSRILQQLLFEYFDCPRQAARIYYGKTQKQKILDDFTLPVVVMSVRNLPGTSQVARQRQELEQLAAARHAVLIREHIDWLEKIMLVCVQHEVIAALQMVFGNGSHDGFTPLSLRSALLTNPARITKQLARAAQLDDIAVEWGYAKDRWYILGLRRPPVSWPTVHGRVNRYDYICSLIESGSL